MSADGEINVAVKAEGVDDAAAEMGGDGGGGGGGDGGDGGGGLSDSITGGIVGGLVSQLLGPLLDVLSPMLNILNAFLAPVAAMLMRLLSPVLRFMIQLLPAWMQFINDLPQMLAKLPGQIWSFITDLPGMIWDFLQDLPGLIWDAFTTAVSLAADIGSAVFDAFESGISWLSNLPGKIATELKEFVNSDPAQQTAETAEETGFLDVFGPIFGVPGSVRENMASGGVVTGPTPALIGEAGPEAVIPLDRLEDVMSGGDRRGGGTQISIGGGLSPFVERIERDRNYER